jgi:PAS domain S-box-containing protein
VITYILYLSSEKEKLRKKENAHAVSSVYDKMQKSHACNARFQMKRFPFSSLHVRLLLLVVIATIPMAGLILYTGLEERRYAAADTLRELLQLARVASAIQDRLMDDGRHLLASLAQFPAIHDRNLDACRTLLAAFLKGYHRYSNIGLVDRNGDVLCSALPMKDPVNIATGPGFQRTIQTRKFTIGPYQIGRITGKAMLSLNYPVFDAVDQLQGVVYAALDLGWLNHFAARAELPPDSTLTLLDRNGTILGRHPSPEKWLGKSLRESSIMKDILAQQGRGTAEATGLDGTTRLYAFSPLRGDSNSNDAYVLIGIPTTFAHAKVKRIEKRNLVGLGVIALLVLGVAWATSHMFIMRYVKALITATNRVANGDLSARTEFPYGRGELGELARVFDQMAATLEEREAERDRAEEAMRESEYLLRRVLDTNPNIIFVIDENENIILGNQALAEFYGTTVNELKGITQRELHLRKKMSPDELERWIADNRKALEGGEPIYLLEYGHNQAGQGAWYRTRKVPFTLGNGVRRILVVSENIDEIKQNEEALRKKEEDLSMAQRIAHIGNWEWDVQTGKVDWSDEVFRIFGLEPQEVSFELVKSLTHHDDVDFWERSVNEAVYDSKPFRIDYRAVRQDGSVCWIHNEGEVVRDEKGNPLRMFGTAQDITESKRAEEALQQYAERLMIMRDIDHAILTAQSPEAIAQAALSHVRKLVPCVRASVVRFNLEAGEATVLVIDVDGDTRLGPGSRVPLKLFGDIEEFRRDKVNMVEDIQALADKSPTIQALSADGVRSYINVPLVSRDELVGSLNLGLESSGAFEPQQVGIAREVADSLAIALQQAGLFRSVSEHREQLRALAVRLAELEEDERQRLARELHDRVGQSLTALGINLNILRGQLSPDVAAKAKTRLDDSLRLVEETTERIRDVMAELRPEVLDDYGLMAALRWYGERFSGRTGVSVVVRGEDFTQRLPASVETALFRIVQEALTNVAKHAQANEVAVTIEEAGRLVRLTIADDGIGFDRAALQRERGRPRWGLMIMQERAEAAGGGLHVESEPGKGTRIVIEVRR